MANKKEKPKAPKISVRQGPPIWRRNIRTDVAKLLSVLAKSAAKLTVGKTAEASATLLEAVAAFGFKSDPSDLAWTLIVRALSRAMVAVLAEAPLNSTEDTKKSPLSPDQIAEWVDPKLTHAAIAVDADLFAKPNELPFLEAIERTLVTWMAAQGVEQPQAKSIAARLGTFFCYELHSEWAQNHRHYEPLRSTIDTPFTRAASYEASWARYSAMLEKQLDERVLGQPFGLRPVYIPLYGTVSRTDVDFPPSIDRATLLAELVDEWLASESPEDGIRLISGGPGSGKSSFAKAYAATVARRSERVLFIPLHRVDIRASFESTLQSFVAAEGLITDGDPLQRESKLLVILDGLDELALQGRIVARTAQHFVADVRRFADLRNQRQRRISILITGREPAIQASESVFHGKSTTFFVLPFLRRESEPGASGASSLESHFDQRDQWWTAFGSVVGKGYSGLPDELAREELEELTTQPLLNCLVALLFSTGDLDFGKDLNVNVVYGDLLKSLFARRHRATEGMRLDDFTRFLEEIALAAWHGDGRSATLEQIERYCKDAGLHGRLDSFAQTARDGLANLMVAFYFRRSGFDADGHDTFEFTHKSFREYLTAKRLVRTAEKMARQIEARGKHYDDGWDTPTALTYWIKVCGPVGLDYDLLCMLRREVSLLPRSRAQALQSVVADLLTEVVRAGVPMERLPGLSFEASRRQSIAGQEALLAMGNACARATSTILRIDWADDDEGPVAAAWLSGLRSAHAGLDDVPLLHSLMSHLDLSRTSHVAGDFLGADLAGSDLSCSTFDYACLRGANLRGCLAKGASFRNCNLKHARLSNVDLSGVDLAAVRADRADLSGARLVETDLSFASLFEANLSDATLQRTNMAGAILDGAVLTRVVGREVTLEDARLRSASLSDANLRASNFNGAMMDGADLSGADLTRATFVGARLRRATLRATILKHANLDQADLSQATIAKVIFIGATAYEADFRDASVTGCELPPVNEPNGEENPIEVED